MPDQTPPATAPMPDASPNTTIALSNTPGRSPLPEGDSLKEIMAAMREANAFDTVAALPPAEPAKPAEPPKPKTDTKPVPKAKPVPTSATSLPDPTAPLEEPPAPATAPESDDDVEPKDLSPEQKTNWKNWRESKKLVQKELETVKSELETLKKNGHHNQEWIKEKDALVKEREDLLKRLQVTNIERDPRFQAYFTNREKVLVEQAKRIGGDQGPRLVAILSMPDGDQRTAALDEILSGLPLSAQSRIGAIVNGVDGLRAEKEQELAKAHETFESMQREEQSKRAEFNARAQALLEDTLSKTPFLANREGDDEFNAANQSTKELAKHIYSGNIDLQQKARASVWAALAPRLLNDLRGRDQEIAELRKENASLKAAQPSGGSGGGEPQPEEGPRSNENLATYIARTAANQGAFHGRGY